MINPTKKPRTLGRGDSQTQWDAQAKAFQQQAQKANLQLAAPTFTEGPKAGEDLGYYLNRWSNSQQPN